MWRATSRTRSAGVSPVTAADYLGWGCGMAFMVGRFVGTGLMRVVAPARLLWMYALACVILSGVAMVTEGVASLAAVIGIAFFMSIMFPTIFSLGLQGAGHHADIVALKGDSYRLKDRDLGRVPAATTEEP